MKQLTIGKMRMQVFFQLFFVFPIFSINMFMTPKFDKEYKRIMEGGVYGSVGGTATGPNRSENPTQTQTNTNTQTNQKTSQNLNTSGQTPQFTKITNRKINPSNSQFFSKIDYSKDNQGKQLDNTKLNTYDYVNSLSSRIQTGQAIHPTHLNNLAGILEANPEITREFKTKGINLDTIKKNYLKQGYMTSNVNIDKNLESRFKNIFR